MVESSADVLPKDSFKHALSAGVGQCNRVIQGIENLCKKCGKEKRQIPEEVKNDVEIVDAVKR